MKITTHKDEVSGKFGVSSPPRDEAERQDSIRVAEEKLQRDRKFVQSLLNPSAAKALIKAHYEAAIQARKPLENETPLLVQEVVVSDWRVEARQQGPFKLPFLSFKFHVVFNVRANIALPELHEWKLGLPSPDLLASITSEMNGRLFGARVGYLLVRIPELSRHLKELSQLDKNSEQHFQLIQEKTLLASKQDAAYTEAQAALQRAQELVSAAQKAISTRGEELLQKSLEENPFPEESRRKELLVSLEVEEGDYHLSSENRNWIVISRMQ